MVTCAACGRENPPDAQFCNACGAPLAAAAPRREERKIVTVLFADLVGESTYRATRDVIDYVAAEPVVAKGKSEPIPVWEAVAAKSRPTIETMSAGAMLGRRDERDLLTGAFQRVRRERDVQLITV